jgi:hypothetical protein
MKINKKLILILFLIPTLACLILPADKEVEVLIEANQGWQDTGIELHQGESVLIEYLSGQATDGGSAIIDGTGTDYICGHSGCCEPIPEARRSSLIGRVGRIDDELFSIGNGIEITAEKKGNLFLRINDCNSGLHDNYGMFQVRITRR